MNTAIGVAVSGGMDSLYAAITLKESGNDIFALHARMLPPSLERPGYQAMLDRLAATMADQGIALHVVDCREAFAQRVIDPFVRAYAAGKTPNPCAHCNAGIKFGLLLEIAQNLGAGRIATGHYAGIEHTSGETALFAAKDATKDQSYFLSLVPAENLAKSATPLAEMKKDDIRRTLQQRGIAVPAPTESQEVCFVPHDDYRSFLVSRALETGVALSGPGPVTLADGTEIGNHAGLWRYTEGQRKGLGIAWKEPVYVLRKETGSNVLVADVAKVVAQHAGDTVRAEGCNFLVPFDQWPDSVLIRTRYRQEVRPAKAGFDGNTLTFKEDSPGGPYTKGQIAVAYAKQDSGRLRVLGGGVIY